MTWKVNLYPGVEDDIVSMPPKIQARILRLLDLIEEQGANLGPPHTESMGGGLFEIRAKAREGIGRSLFCYVRGQEICVLTAFVKKSQKTPKKELALAKSRMKEVQSHD